MAHGKSTLWPGAFLNWAKKSSDAGGNCSRPAVAPSVTCSSTILQAKRPFAEFLMRDSGQPDGVVARWRGKFQVPDAMVDRPVRELSGGWQTRTSLPHCCCMIPTCLFSMNRRTSSICGRRCCSNILERVSPGCLIVSHDREFLNGTCTHTLELSRGQLTLFPGNVDAYLANVEETSRTTICA